MVVGKRTERRSARDNARKRAEKRAQEGSGSGYIRLPDGTSFFSAKKAGVKRIDLLGYEVTQKGNPYASQGDFHYERTYWTHRGVGPEGRTVVCPAKTLGKKCPVCEYRTKLIASKGDETIIKELAPKERQLFNVVDTAEPDKGVQVWDVSYYLFGKALDAAIRNADEDEGIENFADWEGGLTLKLSFEEKSFERNSFTSVESISFKPRKSDYDGPDVVDLDTVLSIMDYDKLKALFFQEDTPAEEKETPPTVNRHKKPAPKEEEEDEEEETPPKKKAKPEPEEDEDEEEEEEPAPKKKKAPVEDEEEEEEPAPPPKKKAKPEPEEEAPKGKKKCPAGGTFGKDIDKHDECADCPMWDACDDASNK